MGPPVADLTGRGDRGTTGAMKTKAFGLFLAAAALAGCASNDPYSAPQATPSHSLRAPVVAPSGPASPFWWPMPDSWWPLQ